MKDVFIKIFVLLTLVFAYVITARTPMMWEDVVYTLKADAALGAAMSNASVADTIQLGRYERVQDVSDLAESTFHHYMNANGRLFPHLTSQVFGTLVGKQVFDVLNAVMFVLLVSFVALLVAGGHRSYWKWWVIVLSALWLMMPESNTGFFLMTYALNYLWSSAICALFLWLYLRLEKQAMPVWGLLLGCVFAFGAGWSHEGLAVGISAGLIWDNLLDIKPRRSNQQKLVWAVFFCLGAAILCLAPGNFNRTDVALPLYNHLLSFTRLRVFWLFLLAWCLFSRRIDYIRENRVLLMALFVQMAFMFYVGYRNARVLWGTEFFSLILMLKVFSDRERDGKLLAGLSYFLLLCLVLHFGWLVYRSGEVRRQYDEVIALYQQSLDGNVYYDLHSESDWVRSFIPTPFCYYKPFEQVAFAVYYTREQKPMHVYPMDMKVLKEGVFKSPNAWYVVARSNEPIKIVYQQHNSVLPQYSSVTAAIKNMFSQKCSKRVIAIGQMTPLINGYSIAVIPQHFENEISDLQIHRQK